MDSEDQTKKSDELLHDFDQEDSPTIQTLTYKKSAITLTVAIVLGIVSGFAVQAIQGGLSGGNSKTSQKSSSKAQVKQSAGISDKKTFKDSAEGVLFEGGFEGEGSYYLERNPDDESQRAYLTSSAVDLSEFVGEKVRVHGETFTAEKVGWLMDVGFVEVLK